MISIGEELPGFVVESVGQNPIRRVMGERVTNPFDVIIGIVVGCDCTSRRLFVRLGVLAIRRR